MDFKLNNTEYKGAVKAFSKDRLIQIQTKIGEWAICLCADSEDNLYHSVHDKNGVKLLYSFSGEHSYQRAMLFALALDAGASSDKALSFSNIIAPSLINLSK